MTLSDLIARLEQAPEGSRDLDWAIFVHLNPEKVGTKPSHRYLYGEQYTTSLDAALTLVPHEWENEWGVQHHKDWGISATVGFEAHRDMKQGRHMYHGATPALALCIAALRARQGEGES